LFRCAEAENPTWYNNRVKLEPTDDDAPCSALAAHGGADDDHHKRDLQRRVAFLEAALQSKNKKIRKNAKQAKYWKARCVKRDLVVGKLQKKIDETNLKRGPKRRYFSAQGGISLAIRRSMSGVGAATAGLLLGVDFDGKTLRRWEVCILKLVLFLFTRFGSRVS
jgi:hypothetical protein